MLVWYPFVQWRKLIKWLEFCIKVMRSFAHKMNLLPNESFATLVKNDNYNT